MGAMTTRFTRYADQYYHTEPTLTWSGLRSRIAVMPRCLRSIWFRVFDPPLAPSVQSHMAGKMDADVAAVLHEERVGVHPESDGAWV